MPDQTSQPPGGAPKASRSKRVLPGPRKRIDTQIHRRRAAPATPPLESEWEAATGEPPVGLRTPQDRMKPGKPRRDPDA